MDITLDSPRAAQATVEMTAEGKPHRREPRASGRRHEPSAPARQRQFARAPSSWPGKISAGSLGEARFEDALTLRQPRVLLVTHDPAAAEAHLVRALEANQFDVDRAPDGVPDQLDDYQLVIFNNWDMESIPAPRKAALETSSSRAAACSGSPATTMSTWKRKRKRTRWSALCPPNWRRRARPKAPPWC